MNRKKKILQYAAAAVLLAGVFLSCSVETESNNPEGGGSQLS